MIKKRRELWKKFRLRRRARELAIQFLYALDTHPNQPFEPALELFLGEGSLAAEEVIPVKDLCRQLVRETWERRAEVDELLVRVVRGWRPDRIAPVDRAVLRLVTYEGFLTRKLPLRSAIAEGVALAGAYGSRESIRFVNGVLGQLGRQLFPEEMEATP